MAGSIHIRRCSMGRFVRLDTRYYAETISYPAPLRHYPCPAPPDPFSPPSPTPPYFPSPPLDAVFCSVVLINNNGGIAVTVVFCCPGIIIGTLHVSFSLK